MKLGLRRVVLGVVGMLMACQLGAGRANAQASKAGLEQKPPMAENVFKDVRLLKGISVNEFMDTMGFFASSLTLNCTNCHGDASAGDKARYADPNPLKTKAREMIVMVTALNKNSFGGARAVTCFTCHRGDQSPEVRPTLAAQYSVPPPEDPNTVEVRNQEPGEPSADQVFDKYIQAVGGAERLGNLTSYVSKGTYEGYDTEHVKVPVEIFGKAPNQRTIIATRPRGDEVTTCDGRSGWILMPDNVVTLMTLTGGDLDGIKVESTLSFPARIKQIRTQWRVGMASIDDHGVELVEGTTLGLAPVKLYFATDTGLLMRLVKYTNTIVGQVTSQVDYSDYREVSGIKMPFKVIDTWVDGQATIELSEIQVNAPVDETKFAKPVAPPRDSDRAVIPGAF